MITVCCLDVITSYFHNVFFILWIHFEIYFFCYSQHGVVSKSRDLEDHFIKQLLKNWTVDVQYMFFPINHKHNANDPGFHWTLLIFDCHTKEWIFYNSLVPAEKTSSTLKLYQRDARIMVSWHLIFRYFDYWKLAFNLINTDIFFYWHHRKKDYYRFLKLISKN